MHLFKDLGANMMGGPSMERASLGHEKRLHFVRFPQPPAVELASTGLLNLEEDRPAERTAEIPEWLPAFPERHTYIFTEAFPEELSKEKNQQVIHDRKTKVESYLENLKGTKSEVAAVSIDQGYADEHGAKRARLMTVEEEQEVQLKAERILANTYE